MHRVCAYGNCYVFVSYAHIVFRLPTSNWIYCTNRLVAHAPTATTTLPNATLTRFLSSTPENVAFVEYSSLLYASTFVFKRLSVWTFGRRAFVRRKCNFAFLKVESPASDQSNFPVGIVYPNGRRQHHIMLCILWLRMSSFSTWHRWELARRVNSTMAHKFGGQFIVCVRVRRSVCSFLLARSNADGVHVHTICESAKLLAPLVLRNSTLSFYPKLHLRHQRSTSRFEDYVLNFPRIVNIHIRIAALYSNQATILLMTCNC